MRELFPILLLASASIVFGITFFLGAYGTLRAWLNARASSRWHSTTGRVVSHKIAVKAGKGSSRHIPVILYSYRVDGTSYQSDRIAFDDLPNESYNKEETQKIFEQYPPGKEVTVYYDPANPSQSVLQRRHRSIPSGIFFLLVLLFLTGFCASAFFMGIRDILQNRP